jgi:NitT/TauT family transport system permease protein
MVAKQLRSFNRYDAMVAIGLFALLYAAVHVGQGMFARFSPEHPPSISLNPALLPYYAARSVLRMFVALALSVAFSLAYGSIAAKNRRAEQFLIPLLDILQSVPVLGFLSATLAFFLSLFPTSLFGLELASIFAIFTGQAWNMTFAFYHSLLTLPEHLKEAAAMMKLSRWQKVLEGGSILRHVAFGLERNDVFCRRLVFPRCQRSHHRPEAGLSTARVGFLHGNSGGAR